MRAPSLRAQREDSRLQLRACNRAAPARKMPKKRKAPPPPAYTGELLPVGHVVDGGWWATTFKVTRRLDGDPAASEVVLAVDEKTGEDAVIKCELLNAASTQVYHDRNVLDWLLRGRGQRECPLEPNWAPPQRGLPQLHSACASRLIMHNRTDAATGTELKMRMFAMEVLGPSLERALRRCPSGLPPPAVRVIGRQLLDALEYIHSNGYLHCDIKPANFLLKDGAVVVVDFGIAKKYVQAVIRKSAERDLPGPKEFQHSNLPGTGEGTSEWKSCFAERCDPLGRRDDLEALGFVLLKLSCGELPWEEDPPPGAAVPPAKSQAEENKAAKARLRQKEESAAKLCAPIADAVLRKAVLSMLSESRGMDAKDKPDYDGLRKLLKGSAADTKAGEAELRRLEAACSSGAAPRSAAAASGGSSPLVKKKKPAQKRRSSGSSSSAAASQAVKSKRRANASLLGGLGRVGGGGSLAATAAAVAPAASAASNENDGPTAAAAAAPRARARASAAPSSKSKRSSSSRAAANTEEKQQRRPKKQKAAPVAAAAATTGAAVNSGGGGGGGTAATAVQTLSNLCLNAKGRVSATLRADITAAVLEVERCAEQGEGEGDTCALAAVGAMVSEAFDAERAKVAELRALGKQLTAVLANRNGGGGGGAIDLTADDDEDDVIVVSQHTDMQGEDEVQAEDEDEEETNAQCAQCGLPFFTASGNQDCVDCRGGRARQEAGADNGAAAGQQQRRTRRTALSPRSPNSAAAAAAAASSGRGVAARCADSSSSTAAAAGVSSSSSSSSSEEEVEVDSAAGLGGWVYSTAAGMLGRLASQ